MTMLTLAEAIKQDRLPEFAAQAEAQGIGPADRAQFEALVGTLTAPQPEDQTSRSRGDGSKRGK
jgi:hypothetical protein